jgi:hypothetical protein
MAKDSAHSGAQGSLATQEPDRIHRWVTHSLARMGELAPKQPKKR